MRSLARLWPAMVHSVWHSPTVLEVRALRSVLDTQESVQFAKSSPFCMGKEKRHVRILFEAISGTSFQVGYSKKPTRKSIALRHWILALRQIEKTCSFDSCGDEVETRISEKPTCFDPRHFRLRAQAANPPLHPQLYQTVTEACFMGPTLHKY